jgi:hypothetical protein
MLLGMIAGLAVFAGWMNIVGNPHVVETVLGLVLAAAVWLTVWFQLRKLIRRFTHRSRA